jgi:ribosomal protein S27AE
MTGRPGWHEDYWKQIDKETQKKMRSTCPRCGSAETYYHERFRNWRCGKCEHIFTVKGLNKAPWWQRLFGRG